MTLCAARVGIVGVWTLARNCSISRRMES
jgi:hypothetical protein